MKKNIFISLLAIVFGFCYSCNEETLPTGDSIVYDKTKVPIITSNIDLGTEMFVDSSAIWDVDINAYNGIDTIFLNDSVIHTFGDGQLKHNGIEITMPVQEEYEVKLSVKDEAGLETIHPPFTINVKGRPTIISNIDLEAAMFVDSSAIWDVDINAFNGIDTIFLNGSVIHTYEDRTLTHEGGIEITMPDQDTYEVVLSVKDEFGLVTIHPAFTITKKLENPYDPEQKPIITSNVTVDAEMLVGAKLIWDVDINAFNGIDTIFLNGSVIHTYENRTVTHEGGIEITMPDQDTYEVVLSVKDEFGLVTIHPAFTITKKLENPYDPEQKPIITSNVAVDAEMLVGAKLIWDVDINAFNGIAAISLNGSVIHTYENRTLTHSGIEITMPDQDEYEVKLSVKDEYGLETIYPLFTITAKGRIASPFLICDFTTAGATVIAKESERRPLFPKANAVQNNTVYSANAGWMDAIMESDLENQTNIRFGAPAMGTANNLDKWKNVSTFGAEAPLREASPVSALLVRHHFKDVAPNGNVSVVKWKPAPTFFLNKLVFDAPLLEPLVVDVVDGKRVFKIDIYVDTKSTADTDPAAKYDFDLAKHSMLALGMANVAKFNNTTSNGGVRSGQDHGMVAHITQTDAWETLTFELDPSNTFVHTNTALPIENSEIDMLTLFISAQTVKTGTVTNVVSNAKYYLSNLRVEKVD